MGESVIQIEKLGKRFNIGKLKARGTLRDVLTNAIKGPFRRKAENENTILWALRDVSFEVKQGEVVGLIGRNGAGKSTLLKILARVTRPTEGWAEICGCIGSLLEVGTGFHPELSGRENIFLSGAVLGMKKLEIQKKFDEIVAFSEVERFLDTPLKHYSSGMQMRLAFAVAAHLEPEILLVDEVLAVGDASFQKKCLGKMKDVARHGRTILFVSHNMIAMQSLCHRAIWLAEGALVQDGAASSVISDYLARNMKTPDKSFWPDLANAPGNEKVRIRRVNVRPRKAPSGRDEDDALITVHTPVELEFEFWNLKPEALLNLSLLVYTKDGVMAFNTGSSTDTTWHGKAFPEGLFRSVCQIPGDLLNDGQHRLSLLFVENGSQVIYWHDDLLTFDVHEDGAIRKGWYGTWPGATRPMLQWTTELVSPGVSEACEDICS
jgi:lipopolysaccharide transport system ATP-binding protein